MAARLDLPAFSLNKLFAMPNNSIGHAQCICCVHDTTVAHLHASFYCAAFLSGHHLHGMGIAYNELESLWLLCLQLYIDFIHASAALQHDAVTFAAILHKVAKLLHVH